MHSRTKESSRLKGRHSKRRTSVAKQLPRKASNLERMTSTSLRKTGKTMTRRVKMRTTLERPRQTLTKTEWAESQGLATIIEARVEVVMQDPNASLVRLLGRLVVAGRPLQLLQEVVSQTNADEEASDLATISLKGDFTQREKAGDRSELPS